VRRKEMFRRHESHGDLHDELRRNVRHGLIPANVRLAADG
jgi:hypothetical protein